jgi:hypothetical protein
MPQWRRRAPIFCAGRESARRRISHAYAATASPKRLCGSR